MTLSDEILDKCADVLLEWGNANAEQMRVLLRQRLKAKGTESNLAQSIVLKNPIIKGGVVNLTLDLNDYWMFVDLGVKGLVNKSAVGIPTKTYTNKDYPNGFSFKNMATPPQMISNLQDYIARKGIQARVSKNESGAQVIETSFQMAQSMAEASKTWILYLKFV